MNPDKIYKAILASITKVRDNRAECDALQGFLLQADDALLDEMARNSAQVLAAVFEEQADKQRCCLVSGMPPYDHALGCWGDK